MNEENEHVRLLFADDERHILELYKRILTEDHLDDDSPARIEELEQALFGSVPDRQQSEEYDITFCHQGDEAVEAVKKAVAEKKPYAIVFLDVRMPPGPDGLWAAEHIRNEDPHVIIVLVTAYADVTSKDIQTRVPPAEKLLYVQKPLLHLEVQQIVRTMADKWRMEKRLMELDDQIS